MIKKIWRLLPINFRNFAHLILHRINSCVFLLKIFSFRQVLIRIYLKKQVLPIKLMVGESRQFPGWICTNYQVFVKKYLDATKDFGFEICQYIFADNVIEHLKFDHGKRFLNNAYKSLVSGGVVRITTPNLEEIAIKYLNQDGFALKNFQQDLSSHNLGIRDFPDFLRITFTSFGHHKGYIYDKRSLKALLEDIGFINITFHQPGKSRNKIFNGLESRISSSDLWSQMSIEAEKP